MSNYTKASYTKLKTGEWGLRVQGKVTPGEKIVVTKKDGSTKEEEVGQVLWSDSTVTLASLVPKPQEFRRRKYECEECGDIVQPGTQCWETGNIH